jgi:hypothetical protein
MWAALANTSWAKSLTPRPLTAQVAMLRAKELGIMPKTKAGKRGGGLAGSTVVKQPRKVKLAKFAKEFAQMNVLYGEAKHLVEAAQGGSLKAAVKLKCLECSGFQRVEVKECACTVCPLYPFRPFQGT